MTVLGNLHLVRDALRFTNMGRETLDECKSVHSDITRLLVTREAVIVERETQKLALAYVAPAEVEGAQVPQRERPGHDGMLVVARAYAQGIGVVNSNGWIQTSKGKVLCRGWESYAMHLEKRGIITETKEGWIAT